MDALQPLRRPMQFDLQEPLFPQLLKIRGITIGPEAAALLWMLFGELADLAMDAAVTGESFGGWHR